MADACRVAASLVSLGVDDIAARFTARGPWKKRLPQLLDMLVALGRAQVQKGWYRGDGRHSPENAHLKHNRLS